MTEVNRLLKGPALSATLSCFLLLGIVLLACGSQFVLAQDAGPGQEADAGLRAELSLATSSKLILTFTLTNDSKQALGVLRWNTPLEGSFNADFLDVIYLGSKGEQDVAYRSRHAKRTEAARDDFIALAPGESISAELDVSHGYYTLAAGLYEIGFSGSLSYFAATGSDQNLRVASVQSNRVVGRLADAQPLYSALQTPGFGACSDSQQSTINQSLLAADTMARAALEALTSTPVDQRPTAARYTNWFGSYRASRYNAVTANFSAIQSALANETMDLVCNSDRCGRGIYAFVYTNSPYEIYLCEAFWSAPLEGTDSRAGTLIHELSHFDVLAGTDDHQYGQSAARALATSNPGLAINNADSHEYFAENTPALSMSSGTVAPDPGQQVDITSISLGETVNGSLSAGEWAYFQVAGAEEVSLFNLSADLDLYIGIGGPPSTSLYQCRPFSSGTATETCAVSAAEISYIGVNAYAGGSFSLIANSSTPQAGADAVLLAPGSPTAGSVAGGQWDYFRVSGADSVRLYQLAADVDLYVAEGELPTESSYSCRPYLAGRSEEVCSLDRSRDYFIGVLGVAGSSYSLLASLADVDDSDAVLNLDVPITASLAAGEWAYFQVAGADQIRITDLSADLDLYINNSGNPSLSSFTCAPYLSGTDNEFCTVNPGALSYIGVNAYEAGSFTLLATATGGSSGSVPLVAGDSLTASIETGSWDYYQISGASAISLSDLDADLDLYVSSNGVPTLSEYSCRPFLNGDATESCALDPQGISYVGVFGFEGGSYTLSSVAAEGGTSLNSAQLSVDQPTSGSLALGQWRYFTVSNVDTVTLSGLSGDLDLYVSEGRYPSAADYDCRPYLGGTNTESCSVTTREEIIIGINAFEAGSYTLLATLDTAQVDGGLAVELNQAQYTAGDPLVITMTLTATSLVDSYLGVVMPTGEVFTVSPTQGVSAPNTLLPYHRNLQVDGEQSHTLLNAVLPPGLPVGTYQACVLLMDAGVVPGDNNWNALRCVDFSLGGAVNKQTAKSRAGKPKRAD